MKKQLNLVAQFHTTYGVETLTTPQMPSPKICRLRHSLLQEEVDELNTAAMSGDLTGVADGIADCLYIIYGTILAFGLQDKIEAIFDEVHASNMSKVDENGNAILRADGKILKGPNYFKPDIEKILKQ